MPSIPSRTHRLRLSPRLSRCLPPLLGALALVAALPGLPGQEAGAQHVADLLAPRGSILLEAGGHFSQGARAFGPDGQRLPGEEAFRIPLEAGRFPSLAPEEEGLRVLLEDPAASLQAGRFVSRLEVNDQRVPFRLGYGVLDRVTVGVSVPLVRRRVDALLQVSAEGANVGRNPFQVQGQGQGVVAFRDAAAQSLTELRGAVEARCADEGEASSACMQGRAAELRLETFLDQLNDAWNNLDLFPLVGSPAGQALGGRWAAARGDLAAWDVASPETLPLASSTAAQVLRQSLSDPIWGTEGFPASPPEDVVYALGDVELHAVVGLLGMGGADAPGGSPDGLRIRSAVEGTLRLATGQVDSFAVVTPLEPTAGHGGVGVRWVTDLLVGQRAGVLVDVGWRGLGKGEGILLAFDPQNAWNPAAARVPARGTPGDQLRLAVTPRFILVPGLSLGAGVEVTRTGEGVWTRVGGEGDPGNGSVPTSRTVPAWTRQDVTVELRYAGWSEPALSGLPFPVELLLRGVRSVGGSGDALVQTRLEMGARLLRRGRWAPDSGAARG
jgi:hypothetical protein